MVIVQNPINDSLVDEGNLVSVLQQVITGLGKREYELLIRLVDSAEIEDLNKKYRHKNQPTNVLSFPSEINEVIGEKILGDVIICTETVLKEAKEQNKSFDNHLIHLAVHGTLHLLGYDHIEDFEANTMENLEIKILSELGIDNPY